MFTLLTLFLKKFEYVSKDIDRNPLSWRNLYELLQKCLEIGCNPKNVLKICKHYYLPCCVKISGVFSECKCHSRIISFICFPLRVIASLFLCISSLIVSISTCFFYGFAEFCMFLGRNLLHWRWKYRKNLFKIFCYVACIFVLLYIRIISGVNELHILYWSNKIHIHGG